MATTADIIRTHSRACRRRKNSYIDPQTGFFVMTAYYLRSRGYCCGAGCRHCPFPRDVQTAAGRPASAPSWELDPPN
ncbi:MAG: hypothetical protein CL927_02690 [Deltaproteobacteria bacterium]|nr:hypothetical protein [Deltaproteobacteria bacterium]HCH64027.1 hypothetical protein [Deltaproteobacteria bacterium]